MLFLAFVFALIVILVVRESWSHTYRCPHCSQIQVGSYHRFSCSLLHRQENPTAKVSGFARLTAGHPGGLRAHF